MGRHALASIEKGNWQKAEQILSKGRQKDSLNVEAAYLTSLLFFNPAYPRHNVDSSHYYILSAFGFFYTIEEREKEKLSKLPLDSVVLLNQKLKIDSAAFEIAKSANTENSYNYFIQNYSSAKKYYSSAIELRDEAAFVDALKFNTYQSFGKFLNKYPNSHRAPDAQTRYHKLIFEDRTKDKKLSSFENFIVEVPNSPYRKVVEKEIFEISTATGSSESFSTFIKKYPTSSWSKRAVDILFHVDNNFANNYKQLMTDSLRSVLDLNASYWVAFLKEGRYGFFDRAGVEKFPSQLTELDPDYLCGEIRTDYLITPKEILSRNSKTIYSGEVSEVKDLGDGLLVVDSKGKKIVVHKTGYRLDQKEILDASLIDGRFLVLKKESGQGLVSLSGRVLLPFVYEDITSIDDWIILTKSGKKIIVTADQVGQVADRIPLPQNLVFDDVKRWEENICWVRNGALEGVINENLEYVIPLDRQVLSKTSFGFLRKKNDQLFIEGIKELQNIAFEKVLIQGQWLLTKAKASGIQLFSINTKREIANNADSIWFDKNIALVKNRDSTRAWLNPNLHLDFNVSAKTTLFGKDSTSWLAVEEKNKKAVYNALSGIRLFIGDFDQIENPYPGFFLITKGSKKGLLDDKGKAIFPAEYDAIIQPEPGRLSLLKEKKFGLYDMMSKKLIKPTFERNLVQYNKNWFVAFKDGAWGFITSDSKPIGKFQFVEIQYWNDTTAWVKENQLWKIYDIKNAKVIVDRIKDFQYVKKYPHEHVVIIHQDNYYGVISNRTGTIIPTSFTSVINLGDAEVPLYFTEKHVSEADIFVVIYYDHTGKQFRKQAYEGDEYDRIFCEDN
jgi:TolA-binding protein